MPNIDSITVFDGESTPIEHVFTPRGIDVATGVARFRETDGVPLGDNLLSMSVRNSGQKIKTKVVFAIPVLETEVLGGIRREQVLRTAYCNMEFTFDASSTRRERRNLVRMAGNLLSGEALSDAVLIDLEDIY